MRKLKLDIDELKVESFSVTDPAAGSGTVHGRYEEEPVFVESADQCANTVGTCVGPTYCCPPTWKATCPYSCYPTGECGESCNTWPWCGTCWSCAVSCEAGVSCTDGCTNCAP